MCSKHDLQRMLLSNAELSLSTISASKYSFTIMLFYVTILIADKKTFQANNILLVVGNEKIAAHIYTDRA
jgi:hypothetical protein